MRSSLTVLILISFIFVDAAHAQTTSNELIVFGQTGKLYLEHTVVAKENWYSVGRLYNISPRELAPFNHLALTQSLQIGQILQIPLTAGNFSQNLQKTPAETLIPVYYITQEKEWMYRISVNHNKVPIPTLEKWNNMNKDAVRPGMHLIVGYLKVKSALSALANEPRTPSPPAANSSAFASNHPAQGANPPASTTPPSTNPVNTADTPASKTEHARTVPEVAHNTVSPTSPATSPAMAPSPAPAVPSPHFEGGQFKSEFLDNGKTTNGVSGIFKSTSGWQDGKYYALMNNAPIGSIVKVTDGTGKSVYVKVLGQLPDMKESVGLIIRISNAAAAEMGQTGERFNVTVSY